jgi:hypothetical protein
MTGLLLSVVGLIAVLWVLWNLIKDSAFVQSILEKAKPLNDFARFGLYLYSLVLT